MKGVTVQGRAAAQPGKRISFESSASHSAKYRPDVDGLRAVAVMAVLLFHLDIREFRNGFVGVDVFFVISGYLITSLIAKDIAEGRFSLITFYERRTRRIFPALFTVLLFCTVAAFVLYYPEELTKFGKSLLTTTFFVSNFYFWHSAQPLGYFDTSAPAPALQHTWSLAVEEQFYLLFPLTLYALTRWAKRRVTAWVFVFAVASFAFNVWATQHKPVVAFYWSMPRAWELLAGSLLAMKAVPPVRNRALREIVALLGMAMILGGVSLPMKGVPFPGWMVLLPCVGTWLVIYAGEAGPSLVGKVLSLRPVVFIGVISYSLYLWHWPAIVFSSHLPFHLARSTQITSVLLFSVLAAFISFEYIERPFRGSSSRISRRQIFALGFAASIVMAAVGVAAARSNGLPQRYDARTRQLVLLNEGRVGEYDATCGNWKANVRSMNDIKFCNLGAESPHKVMFWGDSHVEQMYPAIKELYSNGDLRGRGAVVAIEAGCLPDEHMNTASGGFHCDTFAKFASMRAQAKDVDLVFIGFSTWLTQWDNTTCLSADGRCITMLTRDAQRQRLLADLGDEIRRFKSDGKKVIVCLPFPIFNEQIPEVAISNAVFGRFGFLETPKEITSPSLREDIRATAVSAGADIFDPRETLCPGGHCVTEINGAAIYKDESHLAGSQVKILEGSLRSVLERDLDRAGELARSPLPSK